jgi:hypothetical protein
MTRIASLNAEIETFKAQCARLQQAENASKATLSERLLPTLSELRQDLRAIESEFQQLAPRQEEELQARRQEKAQEIAALEGKAHTQSDALEEQRRRHAERMDEVEQKYVVSSPLVFAARAVGTTLRSRHFLSSMDCLVKAAMFSSIPEFLVVGYWCTYNYRCHLSAGGPDAHQGEGVCADAAQGGSACRAEFQSLPAAGAEW